MFVPYALFLYIIFGVRNSLFIVGSACIISMSIETIQHFFAIGKPDIDDVIFNTLGAVLGVVVIWGIKETAQWEKMGKNTPK